MSTMVPVAMYNKHCNVYRWRNKKKKDGHKTSFEIVAKISLIIIHFEQLFPILRIYIILRVKVTLLITW